MRILSRSEALEFLRQAKLYHDGVIDLPPEIHELREKIETSIRNAEAFIVQIHAVDENMINEIVELKMQLDTMYAAWGKGEFHSQYKPTLH